MYPTAGFEFARPEALMSSRTSSSNPGHACSSIEAPTDQMYEYANRLATTGFRASASAFKSSWASGINATKSCSIPGEAASSRGEVAGAAPIGVGVGANRAVRGAARTEQRESTSCESTVGTTSLRPARTYLRPSSMVASNSSIKNGVRSFRNRFSLLSAAGYNSRSIHDVT